MLRLLYSMMREINKLFWVSMTVVVLLRLLIFRDMTTALTIRAGLAVALIIVLLELVYYLTLAFLRRREDKLIGNILKDEGVTPELLKRVLNRVKKAKGPVRKATEQLTLASFLSEGGYYDRCFEVLREIEFGALPEDCREEYFNIYVYSNLMSGDTAAAERIFITAKPYFERAELRAYSMPVLHTMGVLEYKKGCYPVAENYFLRALNASSGSFSKCECQIYLSLCYLKLGDLERAADSAKSARSNISTIYQKHTLENVRMQLEQAAG